MRRALVAACAGAALAACRRDAAPAATRAGTLAVTWSTADTAVGGASWSAPAEAAWCDANRVLAILAARGDTGAALLVRSADGRGGTFPLVPAPDSAQPRHAVAALRFVGNNRVVALTAHEGSLELDGVQPVADGRFRGTMLLPGGEDSLVVEGTLTRIPVTTGDAGCRVAGPRVP